jgi:hypothetical protein
MQTMAIFGWSKPNFKFVRAFLEIMLVRCIQERYITLCLADNSSSDPGQTSGSNCCDTLPREGTWQPAVNLLASLGKVTHNPCINPFHVWAHGLCKWRAYRPTNHKKKPTQMTADSKSGPSFYIYILCISGKNPYSHIDVPFQKRKLQNWDTKFWIPVSSARYCDMTNKKQNTGASIDGRCYVVAW